MSNISSAIPSRAVFTVHNGYYIFDLQLNIFLRVYLLGKSAFDSAHVLFVYLSVADLRLHYAGVPGRSAEHEETTGQPV